jgi:hypothetical protein
LVPSFLFSEYSGAGKKLLHRTWFFAKVWRMLTRIVNLAAALQGI